MHSTVLVDYFYNNLVFYHVDLHQFPGPELRCGEADAGGDRARVGRVVVRGRPQQLRLHLHRNQRRGDPRRGGEGRHQVPPKSIEPVITF